MLDPGRLGIEVTHSDGRTTRWAGDEPNAAYVPVNVDFGTSMPGGFKDSTLALSRVIDRDFPDLNLLDTLRIYGPGNETVWEGRTHGLPRRSGVEGGVVVQSVGWSAHLKDDPTFRAIYVDRGFTNWGQLTLAERVRRATAGEDLESASAAVEDALVFTLQNQALGTKVSTGLFYRGVPGVSIASIQYQGASIAWPASWEAPAVFATDGEDFTAVTAYALTLDNALQSRVITTPRRNIALSAYSGGTASTPAAGAMRRYTKMAVYGDHGLTLQSITGDTAGVLVSDMLRHALADAAPLLDTTGIEATGYAVPHAAFRDPTTAEQVVLTLNAYHLWEWGVWETRRFFFRPPDLERQVWEVRRSEGATYDLEGDQADDLYNGVVVIYQQGDGVTRMAGPASGGRTFDVMDDNLLNTSPTNPVNAAGIPRKWAILQLSNPTTDLGATTIGQAWLAEHALAPRRGAVTLTGMVKAASGVMKPAWAIRAGDSLRLVDHSSSITRRVIETRFSGAGRAVVCSLDNGSTKLDAILERMGVAQVGVFS